MASNSMVPKKLENPSSKRVNAECEVHQQTLWTRVCTLDCLYTGDHWSTMWMKNHDVQEARLKVLCNPQFYATLKHLQLHNIAAPWNPRPEAHYSEEQSIHLYNPGLWKRIPLSTGFQPWHMHTKNREQWSNFLNANYNGPILGVFRDMCDLSTQVNTEATRSPGAETASYL